MAIWRHSCYFFVWTNCSQTGQTIAYNMKTKRHFCSWASTCILLFHFGHVHKEKILINQLDIFFKVFPVFSPLLLAFPHEMLEKVKIFKKWQLPGICQFFSLILPVKFTGFLAQFRCQWVNSVLSLCMT